MAYPPSPYRTAHVNQRGEALHEVVRAGMIRPDGRVVTSERERLIGAGGEFNASSKKELIGQIGYLIDQYQRGGFKKARVMSREEHERRQAIVLEAATDRSGQSLQILGEVISEEIWETMNREGFLRKTFAVKPLGKGEVGRVRVRRKDVVAFLATTAVSVTEQRIVQPYVYPSEIYINSLILIEDRELEQASTDLLDEKYQDGLEAIMVREDRLGKRLWDAAAPTFNSPVFFNTFTPAVFATMMNQVQSWHLPTPTAVISYDLWTDIRTDPDWTAWYDPVTKHELVLEGKLGSIMDVELLTDGARYETLRVLNNGEAYILTAPMALGTLTQRKELTAEAVNRYPMGEPKRGWFMEVIEGMAVVNPRGICKGSRT